MAAIRGRTLQRSEPQGPNAVRIRAEGGKRRRESRSLHTAVPGSVIRAVRHRRPNRKRTLGRSASAASDGGEEGASETERKDFPNASDFVPQPLKAALVPRERQPPPKDELPASETAAGTVRKSRNPQTLSTDRGSPPRFAPRRKRKRKAGRFRPPSTAPASVPNLSRLTPGRQGRHAAPSRCLRRTDPIGRTSGGRPEDDNRKGAV